MIYFATVFTAARIDAELASFGDFIVSVMLPILVVFGVITLIITLKNHVIGEFDDVKHSPPKQLDPKDILGSIDLENSESDATSASVFQDIERDVSTQENSGSKNAISLMKKEEL